MRTNRLQNTIQDVEMGHASLRDASQPRSTDATVDTVVIQTAAGRFKKRLLAAAAVGGTLLGGGLVAAVAVPLLKQQRNQALASRDAALAQLAMNPGRYDISTPITNIENRLQAALAPAPGDWVPSDDTDAGVEVTLSGAKQTLKQALFYKSGEGIDLILSNSPDLCEIMTNWPAMSDFVSGVTLQTTLYNVAPFGARFSWSETLLPLQVGAYTNATNIVTSGKWSMDSTLTEGLYGNIMSRLGLQANVTSASLNHADGFVNGTILARANDGSGSLATGTFQARRCVSVEDMIADADAYEQSNVVAEALAEQAQLAPAPSEEPSSR